MRLARRIELLWLLACLATAAVWIDFSKIHRCHSSDSLVFELASLYRWTPFYWEQDRFGMFFPLLATPWRHPLDNLLVQAGMTIFVGLSAPFLLGYYVAGARLGLIIGGLGAINLLMSTTIEQHAEALMVNHTYLTTPALGLAGLVLLDRWARGGHATTAGVGLIAIFVAHWINPAVAMALGPLVVVRGCCFRGLADRLPAAAGLTAPAPRAWPAPLPFWRDALRVRWAVRCWIAQAHRDEVVGLMAIGMSLAASLLLSRILGHRLHYHFVPPARWLESAVAMWNDKYNFYQRPWFLAVDIMGLAALATLAWPAGRRALRASLPLAGGLLLAAAVQYAFMSSIDHVQANQSARYVMMAVFLWQAAIVGFAIVQWASVAPILQRSAIPPAVLALTMAVVAAATHGWPSTQVVRAELDRTLGQYTDDLLAARCTHTTGDYWHAWTAMFHANLRLADERSPRRIWAISGRSSATADLWQQTPADQMRIGEIIGDEKQSQYFRQVYHVRPTVAREQVGRIRVLCPTADVDTNPGLARRASPSDGR